MSSIMYIVIVLAILGFCVIVLPFFLKGADLLAPSIRTLADLNIYKQKLLLRYLAEEKEFEDKKISSSVWSRRKVFILNRYIDIVRRIDYEQNVNGDID